MSLVAPSFAGSFRRETTPFKGANLYIPNDGKKTHPAVLLLHGSGGGSEPFTSLKGGYLASQGYVALAFCYFDCQRWYGVEPREPLANVDLGRTLEALSWLRKSPYTKGHKIAVWGVSRGGEQALALAALSGANPTEPQMDAVLAHAPSDKINGAWNWDWLDWRCWTCRDSSHCTPWKLSADFTMPGDAYEWNPACGVSPRVVWSGKAEDRLPSWIWKGKSLPEDSRIRIEDYKGPVFVAVGNKDSMWPYEQTQRIEKTLKEAGRPAEVHYFEGEDHGFGAKAGNQENELIVKFLRRHLK